MMVIASHDLPDNRICSLHPALELEEARFAWTSPRVPLAASGKLWALRRLRQARKLNLFFCQWQPTVWHYFRDNWAEAMAQASRELTRLDALVLLSLFRYSSGHLLL